MPKLLMPHQQAVLFQYLLEGKAAEKTLTADQQVALFAKLMNKDKRWAKAAYVRAKNSGWLDKTA